jgi:uncharacterized membrane protein
MPTSPALLALSLPFQTEFLSPLAALALFAGLAIPVVLLGLRSMAGLTPGRRYTAIALRLAVVLLAVLILAGLRYQRSHKDVELIVLKDISGSTANVQDLPAGTLEQSVTDYLRRAVEKDKPPRDRVGIIAFANQATIDLMPRNTLATDTRPIREPSTGTDAAAALQLGLATLSKDAMHRMLLIWDGNATTGDIEAAAAQAKAQGIPIDVMPLTYDVKSEVLIDRMVTPTWRRENEPYTVEVLLRSTNPAPVTGRLTVLRQGQPMDLDPSTPGIQDVRRVTLNPGPNVQRVTAPPSDRAGVQQFKAIFEADAPAAGVTAAAGATTPPTTDALLQNNTAESFTFIRGRGDILYVDNTQAGAGDILKSALAREGIEIRNANHIRPDQFPSTLVELQNYDAVILANVPRGMGGLAEDQQTALAAYVHELGGGLLMIGGENTFGAGGWNGSRLEAVLPVNMDIPAQRQVPKGALVLMMHSTEMANGNFWGEQCAIKAVETLSPRDEIGVASYDWSRGTTLWDSPLAEKADGSKVVAAIKNMKLGDMPDFKDSFDAILNGSDGHPGLKDSDARTKHVIIISDGDPQPPTDGQIRAFREAKITVSTVTVYPHPGQVAGGGLPPTMELIAKQLLGRAYGPIENNPGQLPQIFIKEAVVVRRSLIAEDTKGIPLQQSPGSADILGGMVVPGKTYGMILTTPKPSPQVELPIVAGKANDPLLAYWQTGLGRAAVFTSDAHNRWSADWVASPVFDKFWAQVVRAVARPPMSSELDVRTSITGQSGKIQVEAIDKNNRFLSFLNIRGTVVGPDLQPREVRLTQTGPGTYEANFDTPLPGNYVVSLRYASPQQTGDQPAASGFLVTGASLNGTPELRDLKSNEAAIRRVAEITGGRVLTPFDVAAANLFDRTGLKPSASPLPIYDYLLMLLMALLLADVFVRRVAVDRAMFAAAFQAAGNFVRRYTATTRQVETGSLDALRRVRTATQTQTQTTDTTQLPGTASARFEAAPTADAGNTSDLLGGATSDTPAGRDPTGKPNNDPSTGLLAAKRRAQQQIERKKNE